MFSIEQWRNIMYNRKRLGQTAALTLTGMAVGLAGGAFAADSQIPPDWNVSPITAGAYRESFESAPTWGEQTVAVESKSSHANVPSRLYAWFANTDPNQVMILPGDSSYTNTLENVGGTAISFADAPVFVDMRVQFAEYDGEPDVGDAKLAVYVSGADTIHVKHKDGTTTNTWAGSSLTANWHQLTVRLQKDGACAVLVDDILVTNGLTPIGAVTTLDSLTFTGSGYVDDLYVSRGNPQAYPGQTAPVPVAAAPYVADDGVATWLAGKLGVSVNANATFTGFDQSKMGAAYLLNKLGGDASAVTAPDYTFGSEQVIVVSDTEVHVKCSLTVTGGTGTLTGRRLQLLGKKEIGDAWTPIDGKNSDDPAYNEGTITVTFTGINSADYKFFKAQIVETP